MNFDGFSAFPLERFSSLVEQDEATNLPVGILTAARNVKYHLTACRTRDGIQSKYGFLLESKKAVTGLASLKVGGAQGDLQTPIAFDSDGNLYQETPAGTGRTEAITSNQVIPPKASSMQCAAAYKRGYLAWGNLNGAAASGAAVFSPETGKLDPLSLRPVGEPWKPNTKYQVGEVVTPSAVGGNAHSYRCIQAHNSGSTEPTWPVNEAGTFGGIWQESTPTMAQLVPVPLAPTVNVSVGAGAFAAARDVYIRVTLVNGIGETTASNAYVDVNTAGNERFVVASPVLPALLQQLAGDFAVTGYNVYEADVPTGASAPAEAAYKLSAGAVAIGNTANVDNSGGGAAPPIDNSAVIVPPGNVAAGIRHAVILYVNRNGHISGMSQSAAVATTVVPVTTTVPALGTAASAVENLLSNPALQTQIGGAAWEYLIFGQPQWRTVGGPNPPVGALPYLYAHNFGFNIPADAIVTGIAVRFLCSAQSATTSYVDHVALFSGGVAVGTVKNPGPADVISVAQNWHGSYGGDSDLWGLDPRTLTPAMVNDPSFGFAPQLFYAQNGSGQRLFVYAFEVTVFYAAASTAVTTNTYRLMVSPIPRGPENTIARIVAFTPAGQLDQVAGTGVTSAGPYFWITPAFPDGRFDLSAIARGVTLADVVDGVEMTSTLINDNDTTMGVFNFTDDYLKLTLNDVSDYFRKILVPPASDVYFSKNLKRMFYKVDSLPSGWYVSLQDDPESVYGDTGLIEVAENNGENGVCVRDYGTLTYAFKERSGHLITPSPEDPAKWDVVGQWTGSGPAGPRAVDVATSFLCYAGRQGVFVYTSGEPRWISRELPISWRNVNWNYGHTIWVMIDEDQKEIRIGVPYGQSTVPNLVLKCNFEMLPDPDTAQEFASPIHFSPYIGKEIATGSCYKWSIDDIAANLAIRVQRTLQNPPAFMDNATRQSQVLFASSNEDGAVCAEIPFLFDDNGVGIDCVIETACPQIVNQQGQSVKSLFGPAQLGGVQANIGGEGKFSVEVIGLRGKHPENGGPLTANNYAFAKTIGAVVRLREGTAGVPYSAGGRMRNERMRLRLTNNKTPGSWIDVKFASIHAKPESTGRPG